MAWAPEKPELRIVVKKYFVIGLLGAAIFLSGFVYLKPSSSWLSNKFGNSQAIYAEDGKLLRLTLSSDEKYRLWTPLKEISLAMTAATLKKEDRWFHKHFGVNPFAMVRAGISTAFLSRKLGASTITMQLARSRYGIGTKSLLGKINQIFLAFFLEARFSKNEILEAYLNSVSYGGNIEGIGAASRIYFGKEAKYLTSNESAILAEIPQFPKKRALSEKEPLPFLAPHLVNRLVETRPMQSSIRSTIDTELQSMVERIVHQYIENRSDFGVKNALALLLDTESMKVKAYVGSADFFNAKIQGQVDGIRARRSPGSALKPFIYGLALDEGIIHPGSILKDTAFSRAAYNPENFDGEYLGPLSATEALIRSRNIPAVALLNQVGPSKFLQFLRSDGVGELKTSDFYGLSLALGGVEVRPDELASLYASLASGGKYRRIRLCEDDPVDRGTQILSPEAAFLTLEMLRENPRPAHLFDSLSSKNSAPIPWKTGTSFGFRDAWSAGVVGKYVLVVWIGNFDGSSSPVFIGRETAGPLFFKVADLVVGIKGREERWRNFSKNIKQVDVCPVSGELPGPHCPTTRKSWFIPGKSPIKTCSVHRVVHIDEKTGLRLCSNSPKSGKVEIFEFWSSDLLSLFTKAGLSRRTPPPFSPECRKEELKGSAPLIGSPQNGVVYVLNKEHPTIPLSAVLDGGSREAYWFADSSLLGKVNIGDSLQWMPDSGDYIVRVIDDQGRDNAVRVKVRN